jgi:hypothetical protein
VKGSPEFLRAQVPAVPASLTGKCLKASLTDPHLAGMAETLDLGKTADAFLKPDGSLTTGERKAIAGRDAVALSGAGGTGALWIATSGTPYPLQLSSSDPKEPGHTG